MTVTTDNKIPSPVPLSATIPCGLAWDQTQASTSRHQQLTT